ncbi:MAG: flippase-like domain-containing protein [Acetobacteraceae bacterium]|nr:flippase-like domain-containing protein [Acetobacteraceae bacterium]
MKKLSVALALVGLLLATLLVGSFGFHTVTSAVGRAGWGGFALVCAWQLVIFVPLGLGWDQVARARAIRRPMLFVWGRMVRDASANCLPFSQVGGFVFGTRAVMLHGLSWPLATATTLVDITAEFLAELAFIAIGLSILLARVPRADRVAVPIEVGLGLLILGAIVFLGLQHRAAPLFARVAERIVGRRVGGARQRLAALHAEMMAIYGHAGRLFASFALHLLGWLASGFADWIAFRAIGVPIHVDAALAIEALLSGVAAAAFLVPVNAGIQEASYAGFGALFGAPPEMSLAVSLIRRARDVAVGVPILLVWQVFEVRRLRTMPESA